jgi:hypothetical protein
MTIKEFINKWGMFVLPSYPTESETEGQILLALKNDLESISPWTRIEDGLPEVPEGRRYVKINWVSKTGETRYHFHYYNVDADYLKYYASHWMYTIKKPE